MPIDSSNSKSTIGSLLWLVGYLVAIVCLFLAIILKHNKKHRISLIILWQLF